MTTLILLPCLLFAAFASPPRPAPAPPAADVPRRAAESASTVRLRKLHLVRPDLIPYPLAYSVYC